MSGVVCLDPRTKMKRKFNYRPVVRLYSIFFFFKWLITATMTPEITILSCTVTES
jgi:hypothetical protein